MTEDAFWVSWTVPFDVPDEDMAEEWPDGMIGFRSGEGHDYAIWCGIVFASDSRKAWEKVLSNYAATHHETIGMRIAPKRCEPTWEPSDRFVGAADWLLGQRAARSKNE